MTTDGHRRTESGRPGRPLPRGRGAALATAAASALLLLLTACGSDQGGSEGGGDRERGARVSKTPGEASPAAGENLGTGTVRAARLSAAQAKALLPGEGVLPGWKNAGPPNAHDLTDPDPVQAPTCVKSKTPVPICRGATATGSSLHLKQDAGSLTFGVWAYRDAAAARAAYPELLKRLGDEVADREPLAQLPRNVGAQHDVLRGTSALRSPAAAVQIRIGATVVTVETGGLGAQRRTDAQLVELAGMLAERSRQIQNGERATARLNG